MNVRWHGITTRKALVVVHDLVVTALALLGSFYIRFEEAGLSERIHGLVIILPAFVAYAGLVYFVFHLYEGKWRFASLPDLFNIFRASTVLAVSLLILDYVLLSPYFYGTFFFGKLTIVLYWCLQMLFLGGPRITYRYYRYRRARQDAFHEDSTPILVLGRAADVEVLLRAIESGAIKRMRPLGILSPSPADQAQSIRGVRVLGRPDELERAVADLEARGTRVARLVLAPSALAPDVEPDSILMRARRLGIPASHLPALEEVRDGSLHKLRLAPIHIEDLLLRPTVRIDYRRLESFMFDKAVVITGGGGSIGAELADRAVTFGAGRLLILEHSEPALNHVLQTLAAKEPRTSVDGRIADVRDRDRIFRLIAEFRPDLVFHAAALKHVALLERDWIEGIRTNVFGSVNVADAAVEAGARAMVMISTDKAIEPVSVLGATKRFAEFYCLALDADVARRSSGGATGTRLTAVRFGNVLASNGSVVPRFKAQIEAGGPVTVTHPDMVRYFMTTREACDLVMTAASHALLADRAAAWVYLLNMGQPVRIVDLAERMIRLSGLEPGRDIEIVFTGKRPGERLEEVLFAREEPTVDVGIEGIVAARPFHPSLEAMRGWLVALERGLKREDRSAIFSVLRDAVPDFRGEAA